MTFFLAGSLLFPYITQIYPPLDLDLMLVFFGVLFFIALAIAVFLDRRARNRSRQRAGHDSAVSGYHIEGRVARRGDLVRDLA